MTAPLAPRNEQNGGHLTRGGRMRDRREPYRCCVVTRESGPREALVRFVLDPHGEVVPDVAEKLPGRGVWVGAQRDLVQAARRRQLFSRALRNPAARTESGLEDRVEAALARRLLDSLGLARKAGKLVSGFEKTRARLRGSPVGALIEASDGARDGQSKLRPLQPEAPRIACLSAAELGFVCGRERTAHAALDSGGMAASILRDAARLSGFRPAPLQAVCEDAGFGLS